MAERNSVITAADMDKMSPQERADAVDAAIIRSWDDVDQSFRDRVLERAKILAHDLRSRA